jgi:hypothetical protein
VPLSAVEEGHDVKMTAKCKFCDDPIEWEQEEDADGYEVRWVPQDPLTGQRHRCKERKSIYVPKPIRCFKCNREITFGDRVGKNGKKVPLDVSDRTPHRCPGS